MPTAELEAVQAARRIVQWRYEQQRRAAPPPDYTVYQTDPEGYAAAVLHVTLTPDQAAILRALAVGRYTLVMASHAVGKTFVAAVAACWWYDCWAQHIVYVTAPTWPQALGLTFKEIKRQRRGHQLPGRILDSGLVKDTDLSAEPGHFIRALNAENGEGFQGEHTAPILIILEEGVGVPRFIWEAMRGLMTHPACRCLVIGNPTDEATEFGTAASNPQYTTLSISALDHPNIAAELRCDPPPFPAAVRLLWLYEMLRDECEVVDTLTADCFRWVALPQMEQALAGQPADLSAQWIYKPTAIFQGRVLGQFPTQASTQVIPRAWLVGIEPQAATGAVEIGCDVARFGDDRTTIFVRQGYAVLWGCELRQYDSLAVAMACKEAADTWGGAAAKTVPIKLDTTGGLGAGPYDLLVSWGYAAESVNSSSAATDPTAYPNVRSELWFSTRAYARDKQLDLSRLPADLAARLIKELSAPTWKADDKARKVVEAKAAIKARLGVSPDLADGLNLAFLTPRTLKWW